MLMRQVSSKSKVSNGLLGCALVSGLAAASWSGVGPANASCLSISGLINIGDGTCTSSPLSFALALGPNLNASANGLFTAAIAIGTRNVADAEGFLNAAIAIGLDNIQSGPPQAEAHSAGAIGLAYAGGNHTWAQTVGNLAFAVAQGDDNVTFAGGTPADIGNIALNLGDNNRVITGDALGNPPTRQPSYFNLGSNIGDGNFILTRGLANSGLSIFGDRNSLLAEGVFNNATNFFGDDNDLLASNAPDPAANILRQIGGNVVFSGFGDRNTLGAGPGPFSILGALGVDDQIASQPGTGITIRNPFNTPVSSSFTNSDLATRGTQTSGANPLLSFRPVANAADNRPETASAAGSLRTPLADRISKSVKRISDTVDKITNKLTKGASARPAATASG